MKINIDEIKNNVVPRINNSINYLEQAINSIAACSIPEYFNYEEYMYKLPNNIRYIKNDVNVVKSWAENVVIKFQTAEQKNNGFVSGLSSKLGNISSVGTGATTAAISVNNISLNQQDSSFLFKGFEIVQNIASNISNGINNVAAVVTSMWNSLFGKMTQPGIDLFEACKAKVSNIVTSAINEVAKGINSFKEGIINFAKAGWSKACEIKQSIDKAFSEVGAKISEDWNFYWTEVWPTVWDGLQATGASLFNILIMAPTKGICQFVEAIVDFVFLLGTAVGSIGTGIYDGISYLVSMANGTTDEWSSATGAMWEWTMGFVAEDWVGDACNWIYQTEFGKWLDDHAWDWAKSNGIGSNIASGIGYVAGIIILTIVTMGIGGAAVGGTAAASSAATSTFATTSAVIAASAATGKYTQESWGKMRDESWEGIERMYERGEITEEDYNTMYTIKFCSEEQWNEIEEEYKAGIISEEQYKAMKEIRERPEDWKTTENLFKGLGYGVANGLWEGIQWYIGGKLAGWAIKGSKIATSAVRVGADTAFNGLDTPVRTAMDVFTYGKTWDEAWEEQGGWQSVATNIGIGLIGSAGGEAFDAIKLNKASKILDNNEIFDNLDEMSARELKDALLQDQQIGKINISKMTQEQLDDAVVNKISEINQEVDKAISKEINQIAKKFKNRELYNNIDESLVNQVNSNLLEKHIKKEIDLSKMSKSEIQKQIEIEAGIIKDNLKSIIKNSDFNKINLIEGIADTIPKELDDLTKARMIYLKLNQSVTYSDQYFAMNEISSSLYQQELSEIYNRSFDISNLTTNSIICSNWSGIYADLLQEVGIDPKKIKIIQSGNRMGAHKWVQMELDDGKVLLADATNNINGMTDLANSKMGNSTGGFIITTKDEYQKVKDTWGRDDLVFREINKNKNQRLINIDENIGYGSKQYMKDFENIMNLYGNMPESEISIDTKINIFKELLESDDYSSLDVFVMSRKYVSTFFGNSGDANLYIKGDKVISVIEIWENENSVKYLYKINNSKINITNNIKNIIEGAKKRA